MTFIIQDKEQFKKIQARFKDRARQGVVSSTEHVFYNIVRGKSVGLGFTPITNANKLNCNYHNNPLYALVNAKYNVKYQSMPSKYGTSELRNMYGDLITEEQWTQIKEVTNAATQ